MSLLKKIFSITELEYRTNIKNLENKNLISVFDKSNKLAAIGIQIDDGIKDESIFIPNYNQQFALFFSDREEYNKTLDQSYIIVFLINNSSIWHMHCNQTNPICRINHTIEGFLKLLIEQEFKAGKK